MSQQLNFLLSFFILFLFMFKSNGSTVEYGTNSTHCPSFICGNITIGYPFWQLDTNLDGTSICGYRGLGVKCSTMGNSPMISLPAGVNNYHIRDINYDYHTFTVVDDDVANQRCPRPRNNFTFPVSFSNINMRLRFHFNCTSMTNPSALVVPCLQSGKKRTYITTGGYEFAYDDLQWDEHCDEQVETWVNAGYETNLTGEGHRDLGVVIGEAFHEGLSLDWTPEAYCFQCEYSGGRCAFWDRLSPYSSNLQQSLICYCPDDSIRYPFCRGSRDSRHLLLKIMLGGVALLVGISIVIIIYCYRRMPLFRERSLAFLGLRPKNDNNIEAFITQYRFSTPKRYNYSEIKRMTNAFKDELGQGGFGSVFKGTLADGSLVAVKVLKKKSKGSGEDFINEVASIGRTCHVNIVALKGFCFEGPKRALVYEFMPNGSLEKFIFQNIPKDSEEQYLGVEKLYEIALGIARGLEYFAPWMQNSYFAF